MVAVGIGALVTIPSAYAVAQDAALDVTVVADQVRSQGHSCTNPTSADRLAGESSPNEPVYLLKCEEATYRVRLVPDQAAEVTEIK